MQARSSEPTRDHQADVSRLVRPAWLDPSSYPFESQVFATREGRLHYLDEGEGRALLFVHGTPSWSFEWRALVVGLRARYRCVVPDHLGFGLSDKPIDGAYEPRDHARRLLSLVQELDLRDVTLVVHDFGGPIGLPVLLAEPSRVRSLVLLNTWMWPHGDDPRVRRLDRLIASPLGRALYLGLNASPRWLVPASFGKRARIDPDAHRHYVQPFAERRERMAPYRLACALAGADSYYSELWSARAALHDVDVTAIWGMDDPAFGPAYLDRFRDELPALHTVTLDGVGHFPQEEAPADVMAAVTTALARVA